MKRLFVIILLSQIAFYSYAGGKIRGELRTEINGFQWYNYNDKEAYTIDGKRLFPELKATKIRYLSFDRNDEGCFVITVKNRLSVYSTKGVCILNSEPNFTIVERIAIDYMNPIRREYYLKLGWKNSDYSLYQNDMSKSIWPGIQSYEVIDNFLLVKRYLEDLSIPKYRMGLYRYDLKPIISIRDDFFDQVKHVENSSLFIAENDKRAILKDSIGHEYVSDARKMKILNGCISVVDRNWNEGLLSFTGNWIAIPEKGYSDYNTILVNGKRFFIVKYKGESRFHLISTNGKDVLGKGYDTIEAIGENYIKIKNNGSYGVMALDGKEIIPTSRGYTYIGDYDSNRGTFAFTKKGVSGVCDALGREISTTRLAPTADDIKANSGYASAVEMKNGSIKYYKVSKSGRYGLTDSDGREIIPCEMEALESAGNGYLKYKLNGFWGVMNYTGKIIIDTDRGYTSIGDFKTFNKRFAYTMTGYKGECDATGRQISKIKVETPNQNTSVASSSSSTSSGSSSSSSSSSSNNTGGGTTTIVVEQQHIPQPFQEWQQCTACWGSTVCPHCAGAGTIYIGDKLHRCTRCFGRKICTSCSGKGGKYVTVYR